MESSTAKPRARFQRRLSIRYRTMADRCCRWLRTCACGVTDIWLVRHNLAASFLEALDSAFQRSLFLQHVGPQVADVSNALGHRSQRKRLWSNFRALEFFPGTRR